MSKSKQKGTRGENVIVEKHKVIGIPAERVPLSGSMGGKYSGDVCLGSIEHPILRAEVKSRKDNKGFAIIEKWLGTNDILFIRKDHAPALVVMPWNTYQDLIIPFIKEHLDNGKDTRGNDTKA